MNTMQRSRPAKHTTRLAEPAGAATGPAGPGGPAASEGCTHHYLRRFGHHYLRRIGAAMIGVMVALVAISPFLLAFATSSPARAATTSLPHPGVPVSPSPVPAQIHTMVAGGMPGWQITLIAVLAAVLAAVIAVAADRAARRHLTAPGL